jgi:hypothetical protein
VHGPFVAGIPILKINNKGDVWIPSGGILIKQDGHTSVHEIGDWELTDNYLIKRHPTHIQRLNINDLH